MFVGLDYLNKIGIIHRDIKLENILFKTADDINSLKIIDLGLAVFENQPIKFGVCGTPGYIAPEILHADDEVEDRQTNVYTHKCDIFSAGVILYKFLTRQTLFRAVNTDEILIKNKTCCIDFETIKIMPLVTYEALDLLKKLLAEDPKLRISAKEALDHPYLNFNSYNEQADTSSATKINQFKLTLDFKTTQKPLDEQIPDEDTLIQKIPAKQNLFFNKQYRPEPLTSKDISPMKQRYHYSPLKVGEKKGSIYIPSFSLGRSLESIESPRNDDYVDSEDFILEWRSQFVTEQKQVQY